MKFSIIVTSDIHGHTERFSQLAQMIQAEKPALLIDNGDFLQGSHFSYFYANRNNSEHPQIALANQLGYDVAIFGNHEFNYPLEHIIQMRNACKFPWIAANIKDFASPYIVKTIQGFRVAIIGATTHFTPLWDEGNTAKSLQFEQAFEAVQKTVQFVQKNEQPDFVIVSYHGGFERDLQTGHRIDVEEGENEGYRILHEIDGIDLLITGHQHLEIATKINGVSVVQPGANAHCFAKIEVTIHNGQLLHAPALIYVDESLPAIVDEPFNAWKNEVIGESSCDLRYDDFFTPRTQSTNYVQLLHDMQFHYTKAQLSVIELPYHSKGGFGKVITNQDVLHNLPRQSRLVVIEMTGAEILAALELSASVFTLNEQQQIDFSMNVHYPEPQPYVYDLWGGLNYEIDLRQPIGKRAIKCFINNKALHHEDVLRVVVNSYRATGAHGFTMFNKPPLYKSEKFIPELMMDYIKKHSPLTTSITHHFQLRK